MIRFLNKTLRFNSNSRIVSSKVGQKSSILIPLRNHSTDHGSVSEYETKWLSFFNTEAYDQFELQRGLNHCFSFDIVPTIPVLEAALKACRRLNDLATAMRVFGALREKCPTDAEYLEYSKYLNTIKQELGVSAPEDIGRF